MGQPIRFRVPACDSHTMVSGAPRPALFASPRSGPRIEKPYNRTFAQLLWLLQYAQKFGTVDFETARRGLGISLRTYRRHISRLRASGVRLESLNFGLKSGAKHGPRGLCRYGGFDPRLAEVVPAEAA